jgi:hypothetical protein
MAGKVYFGNEEKQTWILAPKADMSTVSTSKTTITDLLNGRRHVKRSHGASRSFPVSWLGSMNSSDMTESLHTIKDFADGLYGTTKLHWLDPFAMESNILPPHWAAPMLAETDWPPLIEGNVVVSASTAYASTNSYPSKKATYNFPLTNPAKELTIIIPPGYTFHFGWHSDTAGISGTTAPGVKLRQQARSDGAFTNLWPVSLAGGGSTRTNISISGTLYSKVIISIASESTSPGTLNIQAMIGQILKDGISPESGGFISGRGTTALEFSDSVEIQYYTAAMMDGMIGLSTTLMEVD